MTIGEVLAVIGVISGVGICAWGVMVCVALLFQRRCGVARESIASSPWSSLLTGLAVMILPGFLGLALLSNPLVPVKLFGWTILTLVLAAAAIGAGGFALLAGSRIRLMDDRMTDYQALSRGAAVVFIAALTPVLGTFLIAPAGFLMALGAGVRAVFSKAEEPRLEITA